MKINELLSILDIKNENIAEFEVENLAYDSRSELANGVFVCLVGAEVDGHNYVEKAIQNGAKFIVAQKKIECSVPYVAVENTRKALALLSAKFFDFPYEKLNTIGITGTKGKTTTAYMIKSMLESAGKKVGVIGTIGVMIGEDITKLDNTTPESYLVQKYMRKMVDEGCDFLVMEVSSIGLRDYRVYGFDFDCAIFTNFSHDHIGGVEHKDMQEYLESKLMLFNMCKNAVINVDDEVSGQIIEVSNANITKFGFGENADVKGIENHLFSSGDFIGSKLSVNINGAEDEVLIAIPGKFNAYNAMSALSAVSTFGIDIKFIKDGLKIVKVKGRLEPINVSPDFTLLLDYAHNALSMENVLTTLREYNPNRLICLFGAGGNRPKIRRYEMGEMSGKLADLSIVTADNSRFEEVSDIISDILVGMHKTTGKYVVVENRRDAIKYCIENGQKGDIFVLAGKGHEDYQDIKGVKYPFDERTVISEILEELSIGV